MLSIMEAVTLWLWRGSPGCYNRSLQPICIVGSCSKHLPVKLKSLKHEWVSRCLILINVFIKRVIRRNNEVFSNFLVDGSVDYDHNPPKPTDYMATQITVEASHWSLTKPMSWIHLCGGC
ncbi:hypothetical protein AMECASPLE_006335 [Ameca splendens]|uniref:Uncharacterized protein n=1 Tax=Ameca splendens TaxID=208324 RepID=A0ABV0XND3_9TELE